MFKSLMQPFQLFLKGATGKDRYQKQQLMQQLVRLQRSYDGLQESCSTLQQEQDALLKKNNQLQASLTKLQREYERIQRDRNEFSTLFNYADTENQMLDAESGELRSHIDELEEENATLQSRVVFLEYKLNLQTYSNDANNNVSNDAFNSHPIGSDAVNLDLTRYPAGDKPLANQSLSSQTGLEGVLAADLGEGLMPIVDLSNISLALVGGHEATHREVSEELKKYGLKRCIYIPPHSRESNSRHQIKDKIGNCDLVVTITSYIDHSVSKCVKHLQESQMLAGEVLIVKCRGKSGVVREVLQYFAD